MQVGEMFGSTDSTTAQTETGRMISLNGEILQRHLRVFYGTKEQHIWERVKSFEKPLTPSKKLAKPLDHANDRHIKTPLQKL